MIIVRFVDISGIVYHHLLDYIFIIIVLFVDIGRIVNHHCFCCLFIIIVRFVFIGGIVDHHYLTFLFIFPFTSTEKNKKNTKAILANLMYWSVQLYNWEEDKIDYIPDR